MSHLAVKLITAREPRVERKNFRISVAAEARNRIAPLRKQYSIPEASTYTLRHLPSIDVVEITFLWFEVTA